MKTDYEIRLENEFRAFLKIADGLGIKYSEDIECFYEVCRELGFNRNGSLYYSVYDYIGDYNAIIKAIANKETIYLEFGHHTLNMTLRFALYLGERLDIEVIFNGNYEEIVLGDEVFILSEVIGKLKDVMIEIAEQQINDLKQVQEQVSDTYVGFEDDKTLSPIETLSPTIIKEIIHSKLEVDGIFSNYKHLFVTLGWQKSDTQLSGHDRRKLLDILSQFARVEKIRDNCDLLVVREIYEK